MKTAPYLLLAVAFWGLNFHFARIMLEYASFVEAGFWRYLFGVAALFLLSLKIRPSLKDLKSNFKQLFLMGFIGLFVFNILFFIGLKYTSAVNASLIVSVNPAITLILSAIILKTNINRYAVGGVIVAFIGVLFLFSEGNLSNLSQIIPSKGDIMILAATTIFAFYNIWGKQFKNNLSNSHLTFWTNFLCWIGFIFLMPVMGDFQVHHYDWRFWGASIGIGVLGSALAYLFWNEGIKKIGAYQTGIYGNLIPVSTALFAPLFGASIHFYHIISGLLVLLGMRILSYEKTAT